MSVALIFEGWQKTQAHLVHRLPQLGLQELQLSASPDGWPIWAIVSHIAGARVYWLCGVLKEAGADKTPFPDPLDGEGWEDHLDVPRGPDELMFAIESSWRIVESCLERWTPEMLGETFTRDRAGQIQRHTRQWRGIASPRNPRAGVDGSLGADLLAGGACEKRQPLKGGRMTVKTAPRRFPSNKSWP